MPVCIVHISTRDHAPISQWRFSSLVGHIVYHDDVGDYSTTEPIMDGTAALGYVLAALALRPHP